MANIYQKKHPEISPWEQASNSSLVPDPFTLQTNVTKDESQGTKQREWLHSKILDKSTFTECIKTLSNNKAPG